MADEGATHHRTAFHLPQTTEFSTRSLLFGELYTAVEETIVLLGAGVGAFEFARDISLEYGVSLGNQSIKADILGAVVGVGVDEDVVTRAHRGVGHPEEVLADTAYCEYPRGH